MPPLGDPGDFLKHLDELLGEFIRAGSGRASWGLSFCSLLLVAFMRVGAKAAGDDFLDADSREKWMECIRGGSKASSLMLCGLLDLYRGPTNFFRNCSWGGRYLRVLARHTFETSWQPSRPLFLAVYAVHRVVEKLLHPNG